MEQPKLPTTQMSIHRWMHKQTGYIQTMKHLSAVQRNEMDEFQNNYTERMQKEYILGDSIHRRF